jgi:hypothetical protein
MNRGRSEERTDLLSEKCPATVTGIDPNLVVPDESGFDQKYWRINSWDRPWIWLLDQNRWGDAVVYFVYRLCGQVAESDLPFWNVCAAVPDSFPPPEEILPRLCREGRLRLVKGTRSTHVLGPQERPKAPVRWSINQYL